MQPCNSPLALRAGLVLSLCAAAVAAQTYRIGAPLPLASEAAAGMVGVSGDGARVVVQVSPEGWGGRTDLFSLSVDGSGPVRTLSALTSGVASHPEPRFTADGSRVVFVTTDDELWSAPADGAGPEVFLHGGIEEFVMTPGAEVVFTALGSAGFRRVYAVPADGSAASRLISGTFDQPPIAGDLALSPDGSRVVFFGREDFEIAGLIAARVDGASPPVRLTPPELHLVNDPGWRVSFDGLGVAFVASEWVPSVAEHIYTLYVVPIDGSFAPQVRSGPGIAAGGVRDFAFSPVDDRLVYEADLDVDDVFELYSVHAITGAGHAKLNAPLAPGWDVSDVAISPDGELVSYTSSYSLYLVPADGSAPAEVLPLGSQMHSFRGELALYRGDGELWSAPLDGSAPPVRLSEPRWLRKNATVAAVLADDGVLGDDTVLFIQAGDVLNAVELRSVPLAGGPSTLLAGPLRSIAGVVPAPSEGRVVYMAAPRPDGVLDTYSVPLGGGPSLELDAAPLNAGVVGGVTSFALSADGSRVAYAHPGAVLCASSDRSGTAVALGDSLDGAPEAPLVSADGTWTVWAHRTDTSPVVAYRILAARSDGSAPPIEIAGPTAPDVVRALRAIALSPDGASVVFVRAVRGGDDLELCAVPTDGSAAPRTLYALAAGETFAPSNLAGAPPFHFDAASARVVWAVGWSPDLRRLYSAELASAAPSVALTPAFGTRFTSWAWASAGGRVLYHSDQDTFATMELFAVPSDGSAASVKLSPPLGVANDVKQSSLTSDGTRALFLVDADIDERNELWSAPADGSGSPVKLNATLVPAGDVQRWASDPGATRVVYLADQEQDARFDLYSVPIDGGSAVRICGPTSFSGVIAFAVGAGGVAFEKRVGNDDLLFGVPLDGGTGPVQLSAAWPGDVREFQLTPGGERVVFVAPDAAARYRLFLAPLDGTSRQTLSPPVDDQVAFRVSPDDRRVVFTRYVAGALELFASLFDRPVRSAQR